MPKTWSDEDLAREALAAEAKRRRELSDRLLRDKAKPESTVKVRPSQIVALQTTAIRLEELAKLPIQFSQPHVEVQDEMEDEAFPLSTESFDPEDEDD